MKVPDWFLAYLPPKEDSMTTRRYDMIHDANSGNWKMARSPKGQYVPFIDYDKLARTLDATESAYIALQKEMDERDEREAKGL